MNVLPGALDSSADATPATTRFTSGSTMGELQRCGEPTVSPGFDQTMDPVARSRALTTPLLSPMNTRSAVTAGDESTRCGAAVVHTLAPSEAFTAYTFA